MLVAAPGQADTTFTVNTTSEAGDADTTDGVCATAYGDCTIRAAIQQANATAGEDTIEFDPSVGGTIWLRPHSQLTIESTLTIKGPGAGALAISGEHRTRVLEIARTGNATLEGLTIKNGRSNYSAGGIYNNGGTLTLTNSTVSNNIAGSGGGGIFNWGNATITNSTISANSASDDGGGISNAPITGGGNVTLGNTIVAGNNASDGPDAWGSFTSQGYNLIGNTAGSGRWAATDVQNQDPRLRALGNYSSPTKTHALMAGSPAVNAIPNTTNGCGTTISTDQRGLKRPQGGKCEIGSFEDRSPRVKSVVAPSTQVSAFFSEQMRPNTINAKTFKLFEKGSTVPIEAQVKYDALNKKATLTPQVALWVGKSYRVIITIGAKDWFSNPLDQDQDPSNGNQPKIWFFSPYSSNVR